MSCIGERLKEERESLGLSQTAMAEIAANAGAAGSTRQSQARYEKGQQTPGADYLAAVAAAGVNVLYVLTGQRGMAPGPVLTKEEEALVDNFRNSPPEARAAIKATSDLLAQSSALTQKKSA